MKRFFWNLLRVVLTGAFLFLVVQMIDWNDYVLVTFSGNAGHPKKVREYKEEGDLSWIDGESVSRDLILKSERREGFLSLMRRCDLRLYACLVPALFTSVFLLGVRWYVLLRAHDFTFRFRDVFLIHYAGFFFNNFLPGALGGDIAKAIFGVRGEERKAALVGTIILDRLLGLAAMVFLATVVVLPNFGRVELRKPAMIVLGLFGGGLAAAGVYFNPFLRRSRPFEYLKKRLPFRPVLGEIDGAMKLAVAKMGVSALVLFISIVSQTVTITVTFGFAQALGIVGVSLYQFFVFDPIIFLVTAVVPTLGGWGSQELAFQTLFGTVGVTSNQAIAMSVLLKLTQILVSIPAGILFGLGFVRKAVRDEGKTDPQR